jgi:TonB family protein
METPKFQNLYISRLLNSKFSRALLISLILHLIFMFWQIDKQRKVSSAKKENKIKVVLLDRNQKNLDMIENLKRSGKKMQVVQNENTGKEEKPKDSRFLGEKDQTFEKNSIAKRVGIFEEAGKGVKTGEKELGGEKKPSQKFDSKKISFDDLKMGALQPKQIDRFKKVDGGKDLLGIKNGKNKSPGLSASNDYIDDVPIGDVTNLNTIEFKYYGFYNRIRKRLEQYWGNSLRQKAEAFFRQGRTFSSEVKITSLLVTIDAKGNITKVLLKSTSGINELDEAAIESFNKAGPFPNPPSGMLINGEATIEWGFVVRG